MDPGIQALDMAHGRLDLVEGGHDEPDGGVGVVYPETFGYADKAKAMIAAMLNEA